MKASKSLGLLYQAAFALGSVLASGIPAQGQEQSLAPGYPPDVREYDAREVALLPHYCIFTQGFRERVPGGGNQDEIKRWYSIMGESFHGMHHYCWGLMKTNRAILFVRTRQARLFYLDDANTEFDFVIQRVKPDFVMLPEILTKKGENLIRLGRGPQGILELQRAIGLKPDYWPPYAIMSDHYKAAGEVGKAREVLEKALSFSPDAKGLKTRLAELDEVKIKPKTAPQTGESRQPRKP